MIRSMAATAVLAVPALCTGAPSPAVVPVDNGVHQVTLGKQALTVVRAYRENYNVHSFDVVSFYAMGTGDAKGILNLVPVFGDDKSREQEQSEITVGGGADCLLHDFRLLQPDGAQPARLVVAERDFGESYADSATVRFTYYRLARNDDGVEGAPALYFKLQKRASSRQKYCDVNDAFDRELKMGKASTRQAP